MKWPRTTPANFAALAAILIVLFYGALHPLTLTDFVGGLVFLLIGWALPSLIVISIACALAWLAPVSTLVRLAIAVVLSVPLGLNSYLPGLVQSFDYRPEVSSDIRGRIVWQDNDRSAAANVKYANWGALFVHPAGPHIEVAGDEGCGCFYFLDAKASLYSNLIVETMFDAVGRRGGTMKYETLEDPSKEARDVHIVLTFWEEQTAYRALVEVFDHGKKIAAFAHTNIPKRAFVEPVGVGRGKLDRHFWPNASDVLLHSNLWTMIANRTAPSYFPDRDFRRFVVDVMPSLAGR